MTLKIEDLTFQIDQGIFRLGNVGQVLTVMAEAGTEAELSLEALMRRLEELTADVAAAAP